MYKYAISFFVVAFATSAIGIPRGGIIVSEYFEQRCSQDSGFVTQNFQDWTGNLTAGTPLYFPLMSSLDVLRITQDLFRENNLNFLTVDQVLNSCITLNIADETHLTFSGYCGRTFSRDVVPTAPQVAKWNKLYPSGVSGLFRVSLSDNKSWMVLDICWGDNQRSWAVISLYPTLSQCTRKIIVGHVKAIGFQEQFFTGLKYDPVTCACPSKQQYYVPQPQEPQPEAPYYSPSEAY